jgi:hypothetical protein
MAGWKKGEVAIKLTDGGEEVVAALLKEGLAVNRESRRRGAVWAVTHAATGWGCLGFRTRSEARAAAESILEKGAVIDSLADFAGTPAWQKIAAMAMWRHSSAEWADLSLAQQANALAIYRESVATGVGRGCAACTVG